MSGPRVSSSKNMGLDDLLQDASRAEFLNNIWGIRPYRFRLPPEAVSSVFDRDRFVRMMARGQESLARDPTTTPGFHARASFERGPDSQPGRERILISPAEWKEYFDKGASICVTLPEYFDDALARFVARLKMDLAYPGAVRAAIYYSPTGRGFSTHFDARVATSFQVLGRKRWRYAAEPVTVWPRENGEYKDYDSPLRALDPWKRIERSDFQETLLEPGDGLMLPAGTWHEAQAHEGESLAVNIAFQPVGWFRLIAHALESQLTAHGRWRGLTPSAVEESVFREEDLPAPGEAIDELILLLQKMKQDPSELRKSWVYGVSSGLNMPSEPGGDGAQLRCGQRLRRAENPPAPALMTGDAPGGRPLLQLFGPTRRPTYLAANPLVLTDEAEMDWVESLFNAVSFTVIEALATEDALAPARKASLLRTLLTLGVLEPQPLDWLAVGDLRRNPIEALLETVGAEREPHSDRRLLEHLLGTALLLRRWGADRELCDAGLLHSIYGTERFRVKLVPEADRARVRAVTSDKTERWVYFFGLLDRSSLTAVAQPDGHFDLRTRAGGQIAVDGDARNALAWLLWANFLERARCGLIPAEELRLHGELFSATGNLLPAQARREVDAAFRASQAQV
jgi:hypothetical protein